MGGKKTVLIVDDHPLFREGLRALLARHSGYEVVGEAADGSGGLEKAKQLRPNLVLMDISLPDASGIDVTRHIRSLLSETRVVMLSVHSKIDYITKAFQAGATGYVTKESATERLLECLDTVAKGHYYMDSSLHHEVVKNLMKSGEQEAEAADAGYSALTPREQEVMRLLAEGSSTREIADQLCISRKTVENHRSNIMSKLDLHSTIELIRYAAKFGMIDVDLWRT
jgi:DNA-binding NarL/FixJ family response regulator